MVPSSVPLVVYANIAGKVSLFKFKMSMEGDRNNLFIKLSNCKSAYPVERQLALKHKKKTQDIPFVTMYSTTQQCKISNKINSDGKLEFYTKSVIAKKRFTRNLQ